MAKKHQKQKYKSAPSWGFDFWAEPSAAALFPLWARTLTADIQALVVYCPEDWQAS